MDGPAQSRGSGGGGTEARPGCDGTDARPRPSSSRPAGGGTGTLARPEEPGTDAAPLTGAPLTDAEPLTDADPEAGAPYAGAPLTDAEPLTEAEPLTDARPDASGGLPAASLRSSARSEPPADPSESAAGRAEGTRTRPTAEFWADESSSLVAARFGAVIAALLRQGRAPD
ncbi:hypothetical protein GCM10009539_14460 [Cryptosporangium japonicum]|uniref:Uncharacterized protein n=1 Tax=Cryptosporangium japonicum TaxID=80872 RepID=A0ABN0TU05_9ACTN